MTKIYKKSLVLVASLMLTFNLMAQTTVSSIISSNQTWTAAGSPYIVSQNTLIQSGVKVEVKPGAVVQFTGSFKILIDGEFSADGKFDSIIVMDKVYLEYRKGSVGYNFATGSGSHFNYCWFKGAGIGGTNTIKLNEVSLFVSNSRFSNCYYAIQNSYSSTDTTKIRIVRSIFESDNGYGYPTNISGAKVKLEMDECLVRNQCGMINPPNFKMTRSTVLNQACYSPIRLMGGSNGNKTLTYIRCNTFRNFKMGVFEAFYLDSNSTIDISNNTFDSAENFLLLRLNTLSNSANYTISSNNFLYSKNYDVKISGGNNPGNSVGFDLTGNYWGATDTTQIKDEIYDFNDDITVEADADYSGYLGSPNYACSEEFLSIDPNRQRSVNIYPNPANSNFNLEFENSADRKVAIYDMMGKMVSEINSNETLINVSVDELPNGTYLILVSQNGRTSMAGKVIVAH